MHAVSEMRPGMPPLDLAMWSCISTPTMHASGPLFRDYELLLKTIEERHSAFRAAKEMKMGLFRKGNEQPKSTPIGPVPTPKGPALPVFPKEKAPPREPAWP